MDVVHDQTNSQTDPKNITLIFIPIEFIDPQKQHEPVVQAHSNHFMIQKLYQYNPEANSHGIYRLHSCVHLFLHFSLIVSAQMSFKMNSKTTKRRRRHLISTVVNLAVSCRSSSYASSKTSHAFSDTYSLKINSKTSKLKSKDSQDFKAHQDDCKRQDVPKKQSKTR